VAASELDVVNVKCRIKNLRKRSKELRFSIYYLLFTMKNPAEVKASPWEAKQVLGCF